MSARRPAISVVTPSFNQARFLRQALESVLDQDYAPLQTIVRDGGSTDGSVDVLRDLSGRLTSWTSEPDRGPADAINQGLRQATGEVVSWLNSDDLLQPGALEAVGEAFAADESLDLVYGDALYVDENGAAAAADHDGVPTTLYRGAIQPVARIPYYWTYVHSLPQPTVFFRRRLLDAHGWLDESLHFVFDFELFWRFVERGARVRKLERTLACYRLHPGAKSSAWRPFAVELYRLSRPRWPAFGTRAFRETLGSFLSAYLRRRLGGAGGWRYGALAAVAGAMALSGVGNPEAIGRRR